MGSALAEHQEKTKGSFEPPSWLTSWCPPDDIFTIPPEAIEKSRVDMATLRPGKVIYQR